MSQISWSAKDIILSMYRQSGTIEVIKYVSSKYWLSNMQGFDPFNRIHYCAHYFMLAMFGVIFFPLKQHVQHKSFTWYDFTFNVTLFCHAITCLQVIGLSTTCGQNMWSRALSQCSYQSELLSFILFAKSILSFWMVTWHPQNISSAIIKRVLQHGNFFSGQCGFVTLVCLMTEDFTDHFLTSGNI